MPISELCCLLQCGLGNPGVYVYSIAEKNAWTASPKELAWPVEFVLRFHPKHVFMSRSLPSFTAVSRSLQQWEFKIRWMFLHGKFSADSDCDNPPGLKWWKLKDRLSTPPTAFPLPEAWEISLQDSKEAIMKELGASRSFYSDKRHLCSNLSPVSRLGLKLLREGPLGAISTDKDGGFAIADKQSLRQAVGSYLKKPQYEEIFMHEGVFQDMVHDYCALAKAIGEAVHDEELTKALTSSLQLGSTDFTCSILSTVKTHKGPGQVSLRIIHAAPRHFMNPGMRWVATHLKEFIKQQPHILRDSDHLLAQIRQVRVPKTAKLVKFDIKDFFMSGKHQQLADLASSCFPPDVQFEARCLIDCILGNQIVHVPGDERYWAVKVGTGMGLRCSGELSDTCFFKLCEEKFAADKAVQQQYGVLFYCRFKDDGFFIIDGPQDARIAICQELKRRSGCFQVVFDSVSSHDAIMLDLRLFKGSGWARSGTLDYELHLKESRQWSPLLHSSAHPMSVHMSWPTAQMQRIANRFSDKQAGRIAVLAFQQRYLCSTGITIHSAASHLRHSSRSDHSCFLPRLILPYHVEWAGARVSSIISRVGRSLGLKSGDESHSMLTQVAWKLGGKHLVHVLRQYSL